MVSLEKNLSQQLSSSPQAIVTVDYLKFDLYSLHNMLTTENWI